MRLQQLNKPFLLIRGSNIHFCRRFTSHMWFAEEIVRCYDESAFFVVKDRPIRNAQAPVRRIQQKHEPILFCCRPHTASRSPPPGRRLPSPISILPRVRLPPFSVTWFVWIPPILPATNHRRQITSTSVSKRRYQCRNRRTVAGRGSVIARLKGNGSKKPLLLMGHTDVVPVIGLTGLSIPSVAT